MIRKFRIHVQAKDEVHSLLCWVPDISQVVAEPLAARCFYNSCNGGHLLPFYTGAIGCPEKNYQKNHLLKFEEIALKVLYVLVHVLKVKAVLPVMWAAKCCFCSPAILRSSSCRN
jgi:hypothetical protein